MSAQHKTGQQTKHVQSKGRSLAQWVSLILSAAIVLALVGVITYAYLTEASGPVTIRVQPDMSSSQHQGQLYYVPVSVTNNGSSTVQNVQVVLTLTGHGLRRESGSVTIPFLAGAGSTRITAAFRQDPSQGRISTTFVGFESPP